MAAGWRRATTPRRSPRRMAENRDRVDRASAVRLSSHGTPTMAEPRIRRRHPRHLRDRARRTLRRARRHRAGRRRRARHRRSARPHDARPRAARALPRGDRKRLDGEIGRAVDRQRAPRGADVGRRTAAGTVAHAARARRRGRRWRPRTAPAPSSSAARTTSRASRSICCARPSADSSRSCRAPIRPSCAVVPHGGLTPIITPNPIAAGLPTSGDPILIDISSSITSMGFALPADEGGQEAARRVAHRPRGQRDRRSGRAVRRAQGRAAAAGRPRRRLQGIRPRAAHRSADRGAFRPRPRRPARGLGRHGVRAGARSRRRSADSPRSSGRWITWSTPRTRRSRAPASRASGCRARRAWRACASSARTASRSIRRSCRRSLPWAEKLGVRDASLGERDGTRRRTAWRSSRSPLRGDSHHARIPRALRPPEIDEAGEERGAQRAGQMVAALAPVEAGAAKRALLRRRAPPYRCGARGTAARPRR